MRRKRGSINDEGQRENEMMEEKEEKKEMSGKEEK
jgi:hypothetical protein